MAEAFKDHFSGHSGVYARYRPGYPEALFDYLAGLSPRRELAWDCGTGNGQAALGLARHFARVVATDASAAQIAHAVPHARVTYAVAPAEASPLAGASADLVTVAQALHWFDVDRFYAEVRRVLRPDGHLAVWSYGLLTVDPAVDGVVRYLYRGILGPYWPPERRFFDVGYFTLPFPFGDVRPPAFELEEQWTLEQVAGYLESWSATQRYRQQHGRDPLDQVRAALGRAWGDEGAVRTVRWPLALRVGHPG